MSPKSSQIHLCLLLRAGVLSTPGEAEEAFKLTRETWDGTAASTARVICEQCLLKLLIVS
jgi:hypothetical protein